MTLHIFNPEHDIALATNVARFTAPHAGRQLRADLGFLPALWAADGDMVLVDDAEAALEAVRHIRRLVADVLYVTIEDVKSMIGRNQRRAVLRVEPWGWDQGVTEQLRLMGLGQLAPTEEQLHEIRQLSSRQWTADHLLPALLALDDRLTGEACYVDSEELLEERLRQLPCVLKAPWSSSGRGVRYVLSREHKERHAAWARNIIARQGGLVVEPYYNKVKDFGMEFEAHTDGGVEYKGLSLFQTANGAYTGSVVATEQAKRRMLARYLDDSLMEKVRIAVIRIMSDKLKGRYAGPFGVDMMVVADAGREHFVMHPCVELNLRRTMGHVALALPCDETMPQRLMRIDYTNRYKLRLIDTNENVLNGMLL